MTPTDRHSEVQAHADFSAIRYAQCWEDADLLAAALPLTTESRVLSIASAGDNALALLAGGPAEVVALDLSRAQLACLALRVAAYRTLNHGELLELIGARPSARRDQLYQRCRPLLAGDDRHFWDSHSPQIAQGIGGAGKFERYFKLFRERIMPLVHSRRTIHQLLAGGDLAERQRFYQQRWNNWRWRLLFKIFFSRRVMGKMGRDPSFFAYVEGDVASRILARTEYALTQLDPADNPYLHWILTGSYGEALPRALRGEQFNAIANHIDRIRWHHQPLEGYLAERPSERFDAFNLSDIFEYMSPANYQQLLTTLVTAANPGARLAYWNMLAPRSRPTAMNQRLASCDELARQLFSQDKAFFYSAFVVEEVI